MIGPRPGEEDPLRDSLADVIPRVAAAEAAEDQPAAEARISILRNFTIEQIEPYLKDRLYVEGIRPLVAFGGYDTIVQDLMEAAAPALDPEPDILALSLMLEPMEPDWRDPDWDARGLRDRLRELFDLAASRTRGVIVLNTFLPPAHPLEGSLAPQAPSPCAEILETNRLVREIAAGRPERFVVADWERLLRAIGERESLDWRYWYVSRAPFRRAFLEAYALEIVKAARALKGKSKKCLVLDCDNTLWGGVVGEEGVEGIRLDRNEYPGKAYFDFQRSVVWLARRGVLVCLCSKNNEDDVWEVLDGHPDCLVKRSHLAAWRVNWEDKASNLAALAQELNLGLDSFVFVEDDSAQCELVRQKLPEVRVLQVPEKLYTYPDLLLREGLFDTLGSTDEDRNRTRLYQADAKRKSVRGSFGDLDGYLRSLKMEAHIHPVRPGEVARVAQLTQKTNQFNLTTRRYTEAQIQEMASSPDASVWTLAAKDTFGDMGLTGVMIVRRQGDAGVVDSLLLSCRILGRDLELAFVEAVLASLQQRWGARQWEAAYILTAKNAQVADFWPKLGFAETGRQQEARVFAVAERDRARYMKDLITIHLDEEESWTKE